GKNGGSGQAENGRPLRLARGGSPVPRGVPRRSSRTGASERVRPLERTDTPAPGASRRILNLGCGSKHIEGATNVDRSPSVHPDVVHDLDQTPWPFAPSSFDEVVGYDVVEHVADVVRFMEEVHRVASPGATIRLTVPHFSCANA